MALHQLDPTQQPISDGCALPYLTLFLGFMTLSWGTADYRKKCFLQKYFKFCFYSTWQHPFKLIFNVLIHHLFDLLHIGQFFHFLRILVKQFLVIDSFGLDYFIFLFYLQPSVIVTNFTNCIDYVIAISILVALLSWRYSPATHCARFKLSNIFLSCLWSSKAFGNNTFWKRMLVDD